MKTLQRTSSTALLATAALLALAGCGSSQPPAATSASTSASAPATAAAGSAVLGVGDSALGKVVVDGRRMTAYYYTQDTANSGKSACVGPCGTLWPPITATSDTPTVDGVTGTVGTIALPDGSRQVTVNGLPVYRYTKDSAPGDVNGQGVKGVWYVLSADGAMVTSSPAGDPNSVKGY